jgi:hypothetical protein
MRGYASSPRKVVTRTGARPSTTGPVRVQVPSPGNGSVNTGLIGRGQAARLFVGRAAKPTPGKAFSCGPPFFGAFQP